MLENENPTKDYKYKVERVDNLHDLKPEYSDAGRLNMWVYNPSNSKKGLFKPILGIRKKDFKITQHSASHFGEFIGSKILEKVGFGACDVELVKKPTRLKYSKSGKSVDVPGCVSYAELEDGAILTDAVVILSWYKLEHYDDYVRIVDPKGEYSSENYKVSSNNVDNNNNIELIIPAFMAYAKEVGKASDEECNEIKQNLINMATFDCKFANTDRNDNNYGLKVTRDGKMSLYPLYDNEYILGFSEYEENINKHSAASLQEHIDKNLVSRMGVTSTPSKLGYQAMLAYLFTTYPEETKKAYNSIMQFKEEDLIEMMDECEGLSQVHKDYALRIFRSRHRGFKYVKEEYIDEQGNIIPQVLPGNKDSEYVPRGSHTAKSSSKNRLPNVENETEEKAPEGQNREQLGKKMPDSPENR